MSQQRKIIGWQLIPVLAEALGIEADTIRRIVIDAPYNNVVTVYVERVGTAGLLEVSWPAELSQQVVTVG